MIVAGADGCRAGWVVVIGHGSAEHVTPTHATVVGGLDEIPALCDGIEVLALDVPIGLPDAAEPGGRACDRALRRVLGKRKSSVFSPPVSAVLACDDYWEASRVNRASSEHAIGLTKQCWNIVPKIREAAAFVATGAVRTVEAHPEGVFRAMTGEPMEHSKHTNEGLEARTAALHSAMGELPSRPRPSKVDDLLDACACLWTAWRVARGTAERYPDDETPGPGIIWA